MHTNAVRRPAALAAVAAMAVAVVGRRRARRLARLAADRARRRARYLPGAWQGMRYRLSGRHPDADVADDVLADRVRSCLGGLARRLDVPRVHVMVHDHVVLLHGEVPGEDEARAIEQEVGRIAGVRGVESYLHVGLVKGDTRPSEGRAVAQPSEALSHLLAAAERAGTNPGAARTVVRAVLTTLAERLPANDWRQVATHLPGDVTALARPPRRLGRAVERIRHPEDFVARVAEAGGIGSDRATPVTEAVLGALRELVPEEAEHVSGVLPAALRPLWDGATAGRR